MALLITPNSATATITVTKTLYDIVSLTTLSTIISQSLTANIANATPTFPINGTTSTFSPFVSLTNNSSNITTSTTKKTHRGSNSWWMPFLAIPVVLFLVIICITILLVLESPRAKSRRAEYEKASKEGELRYAKFKEEMKKIDEEEAASEKKAKDRDQKGVDFSRIIRFRSRAGNRFSKKDEVHISDDYARFEATDGQKKLTDLEILKILILEYEEKYAEEVEWLVKHPLESNKLVMEYDDVRESHSKEKRMRVERNDPVADERDRVEMCEKFGWDLTDPYYKLP
ncbi:hypothetical protein BELL_0033g00160 [Botrytis elliptica]|uniref:Uncharacterized protein n=1 Tax=Botrytis elliptica TaxID=278938 RepID=A0A4Z1KDX5_9HELO|nr:hypothetical protein EAE99_006948 [Botrytis elliptica]TGO79423.1 hypothetical protein BELL_0033g00160 [Botrytis elliptica]